MFKIGLKLWSSNVFLIPSAIESFQKGFFQYIELYIDPKAPEDNIEKWSGVAIPYILHAPHSYSGLNFSRLESERGNLALLKEVERYSSKLNPKWIIFHPGIDGSTHETIRQTNLFQREYSPLFGLAALENKPKVGLKGETCIGASPFEIQEVLRAAGINFCLDIGHAICYSAWAKLKWETVLDDFLELNPVVYHLADGDTLSCRDKHLNYGKGIFDLPKIVKKIPPDSFLSIETERRPGSFLQDFEKDVLYLKKIFDD